MSERLSDIAARIAGVRQLGAVVNAMRGIAAARALQARSRLAAVESYSATLATAIASALPLAAAPDRGSRRQSRLALAIFVAEQGFAGAFSERVLEAVAPDLEAAELFLVGTRGAAIAAERGLTPGWHGAMPAQPAGIPRLADSLAEALYARIAVEAIDRLDVVCSRWRAGEGIRIERRRLFPLETARFAPQAEANPPLLQLAPQTLLDELTADYVHAQLCDAALQAFAAENEARMQAMAAAHQEIGRHLAHLQLRQRVVRQAEITAEIVELVAGEAASTAG